MKTKLFFTLITLSFNLWAQDTLVTYYDADWEPIKSKEEADNYRHSFIDENNKPSFKIYFMTGELRVEGSYTSKSFKKFDGSFISYYKNGTISSSGEFKADDKVGKWSYWYDNGALMNETHYNEKGEKHGAYINWYKDESLDTEGNFKYDKEDGTWKFYFENGQMSALEFYKEGEVEQIEYWNEDGEKVEGDDLKVFEHVDYFTGTKGIRDYLINNFKYPKKARLAGIQGKVYVTYTVETTGEVSDISFSGIKHEELRAEAKRLSKGLMNWLPAKRHNRLIQSKYTLPINFRLK